MCFVNKILIISLILMSFYNSCYTGPVTAYTACTVCCAGVHAIDWLTIVWGACGTGACILEACISPIPGLCLDPRDNVCVITFLTTLALPTP
jgi:hypothetical protein